VRFAIAGMQPGARLIVTCGGSNRAYDLIVVVARCAEA